MKLLEKINLRKNMPKLALTVLAGTTAVGAVNAMLSKKEVNKLKRKTSRLAQENLTLLELACDEIMVTRGWKNRILTIDSIDVHKIRMCNSANEAERALYIALVHCLCRDEEGECTMENIHNTLSGWYDVDKDTPIGDQMTNAEMNVDVISGYLGRRGYNAFLSGFNRQTLIKGAVLLEDDVAWAVRGLNPGGNNTGGNVK